MILKTLTLKSILVILNSLNIASAIVHIVITLFTVNNSRQNEFMLMNYTTMLMSAICCAAAVMESISILQITANIFLSKVVVTIVLSIYKISPSLSLYNLFALVLHSSITAVAYYLAQRIQMTELNNTIAKYTGVAAIPLNPPLQVRSDVI